MKKVIILMLLYTICFVANAQWTYKTVNNGFDDPFKKAYTRTNNNGWLAMESADPILLYLNGLYFCDDETTLDIVLIVKGENKKYSTSAFKSKNSTIYFIDSNVFSQEFVEDFKAATKCLIRVNQTHCKDDYYEFNMSGSSKAFEFIFQN